MGTGPSRGSEEFSGTRSNRREFDAGGPPFQAIDEFNRSIELYPNYYASWCNRTPAYLRMGNDVQALEDYNRGIHLDYKNVTAVWCRGFIYERLG